MNPWIDSHAHVYLKEFDQDRESMLIRSEEQGVHKIYMPNIDSSSIEAMMEVENLYPGRCIAMMGLHPCSVKENFEHDLYHMEEWLSKRAFAAIGEVGTDLYWDKTFWEHQKEAFIVQIGWAKKYNLPLVIHCRESLDETLALVEAHHDQKLKGVFHCFTGSTAQAERIVKLGFYLGLGGVSTFKNSGMDNIICTLKPEHILLETDSPYLAPVPHRGTRNEPAYIPLIAHKIASLMNMSMKHISTVTEANAKHLFAL